MKKTQLTIKEKLELLALKTVKIDQFAAYFGFQKTKAYDLVCDMKRLGYNLAARYESNKINFSEALKGMGTSVEEEISRLVAIYGTLGAPADKSANTVRD